MARTVFASAIAGAAAAAGASIAVEAQNAGSPESEAAPLQVERAPSIVQRHGGIDLGVRAYAEAGVSLFAFRAESAESQLGGTLRGGLAFNPFFAVEVDYSILEDADGVIVQVIPESGGQGQFISVREPDQVSTAFARGSWPLTRRLSAHGRLGFARLDTEDELGGDDSTSGAAFGVGGALRIAGPTALRLDYTRLQLNDLEADAGTLVFSLAF
ncbi:MAG: porin family protein [Caulobacterales bacterium]|nr:porin family protein [Caulobacterales bacterium]